LRALWFSGLDKKKFIFNLLRYSILFVLILILIRLFIVPYFSNYSRYLLLNSNVGSIGPLIKENNFNSPLKKITIYVGKKNQINELDDIILFENSNKETKTIIAKSGLIINENNKNLLVLVNGSVHQESNNKISILDFDKITLDLDQYSKKSADYYKFDEMLTFELIGKIKENNKINTNIISILNDRIIIPLFIPSIVLLGFFLLSVNKEFLNYFIIKIIIFTAGISIIIFGEILLNLSIKNIYINFFLYSAPFFFFIINWLILNRILKYQQ
jgi:lipopolysaccharide export LptBFGC system permease protein LptF